MQTSSFERLCRLLVQIPGIPWKFSCETTRGVGWRVDLTIDPTHPLAWRVVSELAHAINGSGEGGAPVTLRPIAPPAYMSQGRDVGLRWRIECTAPDFSQDALADWLMVELPEPLDDVIQWVAAGQAKRYVVVDGGHSHH